MNVCERGLRVVRVYTCSGMQACTHAQSQRRTLGIMRYHFLPHALETVSLVQPGALVSPSERPISACLTASKL